jgi:hypothetical protein
MAATGHLLSSSQPVVLEPEDLPAEERGAAGADAAAAGEERQDWHMTGLGCVSDTQSPLPPASVY